MSTAAHDCSFIAYGFGYTAVGFGVIHGPDYGKGFAFVGHVINEKNGNRVFLFRIWRLMYQKSELNNYARGLYITKHGQKIRKPRRH